MKKRNKALLLLLSSILLFSFSGCGKAPEKPPGNSPAPTDADKTAQNTQKLVIYTSMKETMISGLVADFSKKNPDIPIEYQSEGAGKIMAQIAAERESGAIMADIIWTSEVPDFYSMKEKGLLLQYRPEGADDVLNPLDGTDDYFIPARLGTLGIAYNTNKVKTPPTSWRDLMGPDYKDAFAIADIAQSGTAFVGVAMLNEAFGEQFFKDIRANGAKVGTGSGQVVDDTASGELSACLAVDYVTFDKVESGAALAMAYPQEMLVIPSPIAIFKEANNQDAAKRFLDYIITSDAQQIIADNGTLPVIKGAAVPDKYNIPTASEALERGIKVDYIKMMPEKEKRVDAFLKIMNETLTLADTDYSNMDNWLSFGGDRSRDVDIFAVYPTLANSEDDADKPYVRLDSPIMREAAGTWLDSMDSVISAHTNVYAPLYRQINVATLPTISGDEFDPLAEGTPRDDIFAAFDYYLKNVNKGERPFILIGHSQGSKMVCELATTFLGNKKYAKYNENHIATYVIGVSVTEDMIIKNPNLKFSEKFDDTGVIMSWNTTSPSEVATDTYKAFGTWKDGALVTNPISWQTNETPAGPVAFAKEYMSPFGPKSVEGSANAIVDNTRGLLMVTSLDESEYESPMKGHLSRYHGYDVWFFADSITKNIGDRIAAFKK